MRQIRWNNNLKLILSDVDETIADVYTPAVPEMISGLSGILKDGILLFMVTGGSISRVRRDITDQIAADLRKNILVSHCSGAEVWGFNEQGNINEKPFYSKYESVLDAGQRQAWRQIIRQIVDEFKLKTHNAMPVSESKRIYGTDPQTVMLDDRGPQITFEFINAYNLSFGQIKQILEPLGIKAEEDQDVYDLRDYIRPRAEQLLRQNNIPITPRYGGTFALDFAVEGVSKTTSIKYMLENEQILSGLGLTRELINKPEITEIWGDKFGKNGGTDRHMCEAMPKAVRAIDFREEDPAEFLPEYNIVLWDGKKHLHDGLLEYLQSRHL